MGTMMRIILSISSDFGTALASSWMDKGISVVGTYRTWSGACENLKQRGATLLKCDLADKKSIADCIELLGEQEPWETLVAAAGDQRPIGLFHQVSFDQWENSLQANFTGMLRILQNCLQKPALTGTRTVIFFAGGGTNNATERYSAYTISKIASIKMCELLDFEIEDTKFSILGPGWVKTKIHNATLEDEVNAGENYFKTRKLISENGMNSMERVIECCDWIINQPKNIVGGRNFSVVNDKWGSEDLIEVLSKNQELYKLRRLGNDLELHGRDS
jgi:NADP-dependent 3-hydroxy acid dehydrogenase YdfG